MEEKLGEVVVNRRDVCGEVESHRGDDGHRSDLCRGGHGRRIANEEAHRMGRESHDDRRNRVEVGAGRSREEVVRMGHRQEEHSPSACTAER